jgi:hypothetical protein
MRRGGLVWVWMLATCAGDKPPTDDDSGAETDTDTDTDVDTDTDADTDTAWWDDTATTTAPDCPGLVDARVCAGLISGTAPGDSGGSGSAPVYCNEVVLRFSATGQVRILEYDETCTGTETILDWTCVSYNEVLIGAKDQATWTPPAGTGTTATGGSLLTDSWGELTEFACLEP